MISKYRLLKIIILVFSFIIINALLFFFMNLYNMFKGMFELIDH